MASDDLQVPAADERPTGVRHAVVSVSTVMAVLLYLDRFAVGISSEYIREDLRMSQAQMSWFLSAFFWSYALAQVPAGWFSDRFGARRMLTLYILAWSIFTGMLGLVRQVWLVLYLRLLFGLSQAGAYPTAGGLIRVWYPISGRGIASSIVALGGRIGGVLAPILTAWLIIEFSRFSDPAAISSADVLDDGKFLSSFAIGNDDPRRPVIDRIVAGLPESLADSLRQESGRRQSQPAVKPKPAPKFDWHDWVPGPSNVIRFEADWYPPLLGNLSAQLKDPAWLGDMSVSSLKLTPEAKGLAEKRRSGSLSAAESVRLNRLVLEAAFPDAIKRLRGNGWRPTILAYGLVGLLVAVAFYVIARDLPAMHPWCNAAELEFIDDEPTRAVKESEPTDASFPMVAMLTSLSLWGNSLMQVFTNIGWVFVVTWFPRYLDKVHGVPLAGQAIMTAIPTGAGILGMYMGGWWTDVSTRHVGRKWGRRMPILISRFTAAMGYGFCLMLSLGFEPSSANWWLPWGYVAALSLMALSVDLGNPAVWAYAQDVGGKYTGSILGWANMWGNLGAAVAPLIYNAVLGESPRMNDWDNMFGVCLAAFLLSGICSLVMDSTRSLIRGTAP